MTRILFVDDDLQLLQGLRALLHRRRAEWDMSFIAEGARAQELLDSEVFDVLVTDLRMPHVDGAMLLRHAIARSPSTIRIALSGLASNDQPERIVPLAHQFLSKPCEPERLENSIDRCLAVQATVESQTIRDRIGAAGGLPAAPATFARLQSALAATEPNVKTVVRIVESDPAIAAKVLQVVNSAFFRLPTRAASIERAVTHLGLNAIRDLTLVAEIFKPPNRLARGIDLGAMQEHALRVACVARAIAPNAIIGEQAFLAGILHDVGTLLLAQQFTAEMERVIADTKRGIPLADAETKHLGITHGVAGGYLLGLWGLPYEVIEAVVQHQSPTAVRQDCFDVLAAVTIADALVADFDNDATPAQTTAAARVGPGYLANIKSSFSWAELIERARSVIPELRAA